jgi:hypothetical protein
MTWRARSASPLLKIAFYAVIFIAIIYRLTECAVNTFLTKAGGSLNRSISVYCTPRRALTLCPQLCMGIQPDAHFPARSADALPATLYGYFTQAIYRNRPVIIHSTAHRTCSHDLPSRWMIMQMYVRTCLGSWWSTPDRLVSNVPSGGSPECVFQSVQRRSSR